MFGVYMQEVVFQMSTLTLGRYFLKCQRMSTRGRQVVEIGQILVNVVFGRPLILICFEILQKHHPKTTSFEENFANFERQFCLITTHGYGVDEKYIEIHVLMYYMCVFT